MTNCINININICQTVHQMRGAQTRASCSSHARPRKPSKHSHSPSPLSRPRSEHSASSEIVPRSGVLPVAVIASTTLTINPPATAFVLTTPADIGNAPPTAPVEVPVCALAMTSRRNCTPVWPGLSLNVTRKSIVSARAVFTSVVLKLSHPLDVPGTISYASASFEAGTSGYRVHIDTLEHFVRERLERALHARRDNCVVARCRDAVSAPHAAPC